MRAYVFPGQGTQRKGMGQGLFEELRELTAQADEILGYSIERLCVHDPDGALARTELAQPAIYVTNALRYVKERARNSVDPDYVAGHSLGEYNALFAARAFDFATGLRLVKRRGELMAKADGGAMAAVVGITEEAIDAVLKEHGAGGVVIANCNTRSQFVISGSKAEIARLKPIFAKHAGVKAFIPLRTSGAFHSPHMEAARLEFEAFVDRIDLADPVLPVISNVTARPHETRTLKALLAAQITQPVRWTESVEYLRSVGVSTFVEIGEGKVLTGLIEKIPGAGAARAIPSEAISAPPKVSGSPYLTRVAERWAQRRDDVVQVVHDDDRVAEITGGALLDRVNRWGSALASILPPQEKAVLFFPQGTAYVTALLACWHANVVAIPTPVTSATDLDQRSASVRAILESSGAKTLLCDESLLRDVSRLAEERGLAVIPTSRLDAAREATPMRAVGERELALVLYTSGSTSQPKGVMLDHGAILRTAACAQWCVSEESRIVSWLPQFHAFGITFGLLTPLVHGALSVLATPESFVRDPSSWLALIDRYEATHTGAPNFALDYCCSAIDEKAPLRLSLASLRSLVCGGDVISKEHYDRFSRRFAALGLKPNVLTPNFGMSEAGPITLKKVDEPIRSLSLDKDALARRRVERAAPGRPSRVVVGCGEPDGETRIVIVDPETREPCAPSAIGEVWVRSSRQAQGYLNDPAATREAFDGVVKTTGEGGFLRTGDLGFVDDGTLFIVGREKDVIVVRGKKYDSADLELTLRGALEGAASTRGAIDGAPLPCAVFSRDVEGEEKVVVVHEVEKAAASREDCAALARAIVGVVSEAFQLTVSDVVLVDRGGIPVTGSKKIRRKLCMEQLASGSLPVVWRLAEDGAPERSTRAHERPHADDLVDVLKERVLVPQLGEWARDLDEQRPFSQLGLDSIDYIRLARKVEAVFGVPFTPGMFATYRTSRALVDHVKAGEHAHADAHAAAKKPWRAYRDEEVVRLLRRCVQGTVSLEKAVSTIRERIR